MSHMTTRLKVLEVARSDCSITRMKQQDNVYSLKKTMLLSQHAKMDGIVAACFVHHITLN